MSPAHRTLALRFYAGTFLIASATLAYEISLTRILSVITWYYLAFFAISLGMVGMTAGALTVYANPTWFTGPERNTHFFRAALAQAILTPVALIALCINPMPDGQGLTGFLILTGGAFSAMLPFYASGLVITGILTRAELPVGRSYAADLGGAASGCLVVLLALSVLDPMSLILVTALMACAAAGLYLGRWRRQPALVGTVLAALALGNAMGWIDIRPRFVKGSLEDAGKYELIEWNTFSRVTVEPRRKGEAHFWASAGRAFQVNHNALTKDLVIDGNAATVIQKMASNDDVADYWYDVTNVGHYLERRGLACIIGVGGGRDIQSALLFGYPKVLGVELNPILVRLLTGRFAEFAGLQARTNVTIVADEARSYLSRHDRERCTFLQMSLVDTWAATAAGAFSLSENALYTLEAFRLFLDRLTPDGLLSVTRWAHEYETGRLVSLAVTALFESGIERPREHIAVLQAGSVATLLVSKAPFTRSDVGRFAAVAERLRFGVWVVPGSSSRSVLFEGILSARSRAELEERLDDHPMNLIAPTDEDPYFFNLLKLSSWNHPTSEEHWAVKGNMRASQMLLTLVGVQLVLVLATVLMPLVRTAPGRPHFAKDRRFGAGAVYFSAIGAGFMFVEIGLIQKFNIYLGHPIYSLAVLLFTLILGAGVGSLASERIPVEAGGRWLRFPLVIAATVLIYRFASDGLIAATITQPMGLKIPLTVSLLFPVGVLMGICFPLGMRLCGAQGAAYTPWFWALNGIFGVLSSSLAVLVSIYAGISTSLYIGAGCYLLLSACIPFLAGRRARDAVEGV